MTAQNFVKNCPESVTVHGPTAISNVSTWSVENANVFAHFMEVIKFLSNSAWIRQIVSYSYPTSGPVPTPPHKGWSKIAEPLRNGNATIFIRPDLYTLMSILALIRQMDMTGRDQLFTEACKIYCEHSSKEKIDWVGSEKDQFDKVLSDEPKEHKVGKSGKDIINLFLYNFGLIHPLKKGEDNAKEFRLLIEAYGPEYTFCAFHETLHLLVYYAQNVAAVVAQDFKHWIDVDKVIPPNRISFEEVLGESKPPIEKPDTELDAAIGIVMYSSTGEQLTKLHDSP